MPNRLQSFSSARARHQFRTDEVRMKLYAVIVLALLTALGACNKGGAGPDARDAQHTAISEEDARAIAKHSYVYAFPMMENYRTMYTQVIDRTAPGHIGPFNQLVHETKLLGPEFKDIVRPNNDTMYSFAWLDLRAQPMLVSVPRIEGRYYSVQLVDMFTHNFAYIGTRATGTEAGSYVVAGPGWQGTKPGDAKGVFRAESNFVYCIIRTAVDGAEDVPAVRRIQAQYRLTAMNVFLGRSRVPATSGITFPAYDAENAKSAAFIDLFNFLLGQVRVPAEEHALFERFAEIGIRPGALSASLALTPTMRAAIEDGVAAGISKIAGAVERPGELTGVTSRSAGGWHGVHGLFGSGSAMRSKYLVRAAAAAIGLYGNDAAEAYYPLGSTDSMGRQLDASKHRYVIRFEKDQLPQVDAFWSMTMYDHPDQLMVDNLIGRYSIGDRSRLQYGKDGSLTIYVQHESPGKRRQSNWLPAPDGPFSLQLRMYLPRPAALNPLYLPPAIRASK